MNIQPIRLYGEDDIEEKPQAPTREPIQDEEVNLPPPEPKNCEGIEYDEPDEFDNEDLDNIIKDKEEVEAPKKKNSLFGEFSKNTDKKDSQMPFIYVAMALGLIKFIY